MRRLFITGTGTGVGKTFVTSALAYQLRKNNKVAVIKPIVTGWTDEKTDTHLLLRANGQVVNKDSLDKCTPWRFKAALSPDMAALREGRNMKFEEVRDFCQLAGVGADYVLVEGAGGLMTPINSSKTFRDLIVALELPVVLVTGSYLGSISHCLTALESLREMREVLVIVNESLNSEVGLAETAESIRQFTTRPVITIPQCASYKNVPDLSAIIIS